MEYNNEHPIGGYFELELPQKNNFHLSNGIFLNSGRHAFEHILVSQNIAKIAIPYFTCEVILEPLRRNGISCRFYNINEKFELSDDIILDTGEYLLYTNYFGLKDEYIKALYVKYKNKLIVDNAQALYSPSDLSEHTFYSPRKFVGIPDGGIAFTNSETSINYKTATSFQRCSHLMKRIDLDAQQGYRDFKINDSDISNQEIQFMSRLTTRLIDSIDFEKIRQTRTRNFSIIHNCLHRSNLLPLVLSSTSICPMAYPYLTDDPNLRQRLIDNKIFVATYWPNVFEWCSESDLEYQLAKNIIPFPIDQRYSEEDMERIVNITLSTK